MQRSRFSFIAGWMVLAAVLALGPRSPALERWFYVNQNLLVNQNITNLVALMRSAAKAGYDHMLLYDSKFSFLATMDAQYFQNVATLKQTALACNLEIVPCVFPIGYSNDVLFNNPNLIEGMPVRNALLVVSNNIATIQADPPVAFPVGGFSNLTRWTWRDSTVVEDNGTARVTDPNGNARIVQQLTVRPFAQYHISVQVKTTNFVVAPNVEVLGAGGQCLNYNDLGVQPTQDWTTHHEVFNSLSNTTVSAYFGVWGGTTGSLWWSNPVIEEVAFLNLIRRPGAPLAVQTQDGTPLAEGTDFLTMTDPLMGSQPYAGCYDVYHAPPLLHTLNLINGTRLLASWFHAVTVYDDQAMVCPSEPETLALLLDQAQRVHAAFGARSYFMGHDEIRVLNWCQACQNRQMDAGPMLADNVSACAAILRQVNPGGSIYVWSDMFDPNQNAQANYYLVRGNLAGSWRGLDNDIIIVPWDYGTRAASLGFFAGLGNRQLIAGYYDSDPTLVTNWLAAAQPYPGICGVMYTTWEDNYADIAQFEQLVTGYPAPSLWLTPRLRAHSLGPQQGQLVLEGERGLSYSIETSPNLGTWTTWTNVTADDATMTFPFPSSSAPAGPQFFRAFCAQ